MKILVTGDNGFIGKQIVSHLRRLGHDVYGCGRRPSKLNHRKALYIDGNEELIQESERFPVVHDIRYVLDLKNRSSVVKMLSDCGPDVIIHCAANATPQTGIDGAYSMYNDNVMSTFTLAKEASQKCKFIFLSSIVVYGDVKPNIPTEWIDVCHSISPTSMYGLSKSNAEKVLQFLRDESFTKIIRMGAIVGPGLTHGIIKDFIKKLKTDSEYLEVLGDKPGSSKPFLHVSDLLRVINLLLEDRTNKQNIHNICNKDQASVEEIANSVMEVMNIHKPIKWLGSEANWKGDNKILRAKVSNLGVGWEPSLDSIGAIRLSVKENL